MQYYCMKTVHSLMRKSNMDYGLVLMAYLIIVTLNGLSAPGGTERDKQGRFAFNVMFNSAVIYFLVEGVLWLAH